MRKWIFLPVFIMIGSLVAAQGGVGLRLNIASPVGEFADNVNNLGAGFDADFTYYLVDYFGIGLSGGYINYGQEKYEESFSSTIYRVYVDVTTNNNLAYLDLHLRGDLPLGFIRPYVEARAGASYLWTQSKIESQYDYGDDDDVIASSTNFDDIALNYGFGGGIMIRIFKGTTGDDGESSGPMYVDVKVLYLGGGNAEYLTEGSIRDNPTGPGVIYDVSESQTSVLTFQVGIAGLF